MMGTQLTQQRNNVEQHAGVIQSSIALLQERFRQLQKVKEMREKRDLLRMFSDYNNPTISSSTNNNNNNNNNNNISPSPSPSPSSGTSTITTMQMQHRSTSTGGHYEGDDELQVFLPPNYYNHINHHHHHHHHHHTKPPVPSYHSSSSSSPPSLSHNLSDISLSLSPPTVSLHHSPTTTFGGRFEASLTACKPQDSHHSSSLSSSSSSSSSDVDTTLHL